MKKEVVILKATIMLCDFVQIVQGKLYIMGGGWERTLPSNPNMGVAITVELDWEDLEKAYQFELELQDQGGTPVSLPDSSEPLVITGKVEAKAISAHPKEMPLTVKQAINLQNLNIDSGKTYRWELRINGNPETSTFFFTE